MSFSSNFREQWTSLTDYIVSGLMRESGYAHPDFLQKSTVLYNNELLRWSTRGQYNTEWLRVLRAADEAVADEFEAALRDFKFTQPVGQSNGSPSALPYVLGGAAIGAGVGFMIGFGILGSIVGCIAGTVIGLIVGSKAVKSGESKKNDNEIDAYEAQLKSQGDRLEAIVRKADGKESDGMYS